VQFVFPVSPFRLNERVTLQKGVFLFQGDVRQSFEQNLRALEDPPAPIHITKFVLPGDCRQQFAEALYDLNITDATLFPGLEGFGRSINMNLRFLERRNPL
jgi:hypothetical protein